MNNSSASNMAEKKRPGLLSLPWELRRPIIAEVVKGERKSSSAFTRRLIENRVRLRNRFDENFPETTNIYVPRRKVQRLHGNALRATNRQLRYETNQVFEEEMQAGNIKENFVLNITIVKDVGVFPTWISFPYRPKHLKTLRVNFRVVRPGTSTIPKEWIEAARYEASENFTWDTSPANWNILVALVLYSFGCFSKTPNIAQTPDNLNSRQEVIQPRTLDRKVNDSQRPRPESKSSRLGTDGKIRRVERDTANAYFVPSAAYVADELLIDFDDFEYDFQGKPISYKPIRPGRRRHPKYEKKQSWGPFGDPLEVEDSAKSSRFYRQGHIQFGRDIFQDFSDIDGPYMESEEFEGYQHMIKHGTIVSYQLEERVTDLIHRVRERHEHKTHSAYLGVLAGSVGQVNVDQGERVNPLVYRYPYWWIHDFRYFVPGHSEYYYSETTMEEDWAEDIAGGYIDQSVIEDLHILRKRRKHGWIREEDFE